MSYLVQCDRTWPSTGTTEFGLENGVLVPPATLDDPEVLTFDGENTLVTPGWINAHSHLELSGVSSIDYNGNFLDWIYDVLDHKRSRSEETITEDYRDGVESLLSSGVTRVVDHCDQTGAILSDLDDLGPAIHLHKELIAFRDDQIQSLKHDSEEFLEDLEAHGAAGGLAPHAPYSAHPEVYRWAAGEVRERGCTLSTHLHEIESELDFALDNDGDFLELLRERTDRQVESPYYGSRPLPFLARDEVFSGSSFGVHLNYLNDEDRRWLKTTDICPVFCPKSYTYFNHNTLPVEDWLEEDINFALGTDSLASNDTLDMLEELRQLDRLLDNPRPERVLEALTINPAEVLNCPSRGVLSWGTPADLSVFDVPAGDEDALARGRGEALATFRDGELIWQQAN